MKWTKKAAFHIKKAGSRKPLLKFILDCICASLAAYSKEAEAPDASDRFSGHHFPELIPLKAKKQNPQKKGQDCSRHIKNRKGVQIPLWDSVLLIQIFVQPHDLKFFTPNDTGLSGQSARPFQRTFITHIYVYFALVKVQYCAKQTKFASYRLDYLCMETII